MSETTALTAEYRKVIRSKFTTKRDGSPLACVTCGQSPVAFAATNGSDWHSYCATCAASQSAQISGLVLRVEALVAPLGEDIPAEVLQAVSIATPLVERVQAGDMTAFAQAKAVLFTVRTLIGQAKRAAAPAPVRTNAYGGKCATCHVWVAPQGGRIERINGRWTTFHLDGQCPTVAPEVTEAAGVDNGLYLHDNGGIYKLYTTQNDRQGCKVLIVSGGHGSFEYVKGGVSSVRQAVAQGKARKLTQDEATAFGRQHGFCVNCALDLTDDRSLAVGYGPVCANNNGWFYPSQAQAAEILQRPTTVA